MSGDDGLRLEPTTYLCDGCTVGPPAWRYSVPPNTTLLRLKDNATGRVIDLMKLADSWGACDACRPIVDAALAARTPEAFEAAAGRLASRLIHLSPLRGQTAERRAFFHRGLVGAYKRVLPLMALVGPCVRGDSPMDAMQVTGPVAEAFEHAAPEGKPPAPGTN